MASINKFYLRWDTQTINGTGPTSSQSATTPTTTGGYAPNYNLKLDAAKYGTQQAVYCMTAASKSAQTNWHLKWASAPLAAQTISAQTVSVHLGVSMSSTNVACHLDRGCAYIWRPSNGTLVGRLWDVADAVTLALNTSEQALSYNVTNSAVTCQAGDILVLEIWTRETQSMATAYYVYTYFGGNTEDSATDNAAYINFTTALVTQEQVKPNVIGPTSTVLSPQINNRPAAWPRRIPSRSGTGGSVVAEDTFTRTVGAASFYGWDGRGACCGVSSPTGLQNNFLWAFGSDFYGASWYWTLAVDGSRASMYLTTTGNAGGSGNSYYAAWGQANASGVESRSVVQGKFTLPDPALWTHPYTAFELGVTSAYTQYLPGYPSGTGWPTLPAAYIRRFQEGLYFYMQEFDSYWTVGPQAGYPLSVASGDCTFWIKLQVGPGLHFSSKFWLDGDTEPTDWMLEGDYYPGYPSYNRSADILAGGPTSYGPVVYMGYYTGGYGHEYGGDITTPNYYVDNLKMWNDIPPSVWAPGVEHVVSSGAPFPYIGGGYYG